MPLLARKNLTTEDLLAAALLAAELGDSFDTQRLPSDALRELFASLNELHVSVPYATLKLLSRLANDGRAEVRAETARALGWFVDALPASCRGAPVGAGVRHQSQSARGSGRIAGRPDPARQRSVAAHREWNRTPIAPVEVLEGGAPLAPSATRRLGPRRAARRLHQPTYDARRAILWLPLLLAGGCAAEKANGRPWIHDLGSRASRASKQRI